MPSTLNADLELLLYHNRVQLGNADVLYSDGSRYRPALIAANYLKDFSSGIKNVLVLGTGLASIVRVMQRKGYKPKSITLVDIDKVVLQWAMEFLPEYTNATLNPVCTDASVFITQDTEKYDLIFIDIFAGRVVPTFVTTEAFLTRCRERLLPGGHLAFNYIINNNGSWELTKDVFGKVFPSHKIISQGGNQILVASLAD